MKNLSFVAGYSISIMISEEKAKGTACCGTGRVFDKNKYSHYDP